MLSSKMNSKLASFSEAALLPAKAQLGRVLGRHFCHSAGTCAFAVRVSDRYGDKSGQPSPCLSEVMALVRSRRCSCKVQVGRWDFPGRRAVGRGWVREWHQGCCLGFGISIAPRSSAALSLLFIYCLGVSSQCKMCQPAAVVWEGQVSIAHLSWYVHHARLSAWQTGLPSCGHAISSACGNTSACHVASVSTALLRWFCCEQLRRMCGEAHSCTLPQGKSDLLQGGGSPGGPGPGQDPGCIRGVNLSMVQTRTGVVPLCKVPSEQRGDTPSLQCPSLSLKSSLGYIATG